MALKPNELIPILPNRSGQRGWDQADFAAEVNAVVSGGGITIADEGAPLPTDATTLDFVGAGVTASGAGAVKTITIPGGGEFQSAPTGNLFAGANALGSLTTGNNNFAAMDNALANVTTQSFNIGIGPSAGRQCTSTTLTTAIGYLSVSGSAAAALTGNQNTGVGDRALTFLTGAAQFNSALGALSGSRVTGDFNTMLGARTGSETVTLTGDLSTLVGYQAGRTMQGAAANNTLIGSNAGDAVTTGSNVVCLGRAAGPSANLSNQLFIDITQRNDPLIGGDFSARTVSLQNMVFDADQSIGLAQDNYVLTYDDGTGLISLEPAAGGGLFSEDANNNILGGTNALVNITTGVSNFAGGVQAGEDATTGGQNVLLGENAGRRITTSTGNVAIGRDTVSGGGVSALLVSGSFNTGVGYEAGATISGGAAQNTCIGYVAGRTITTGDFNTFVGGSAGPNIFALTGSRNTALGHQSGDGLQSTAANNTFLGANAGQNITTGQNMICIGNAAGPAANQFNNLYIDVTQRADPLIGGDFSSRDVNINDNLNVAGNGDVAGTFDCDGNTVNTSFRIDNNATAGETRMLLWDVDNGTLERVSVGAADSGGTGFKVLRIPN